MNFSISSLGALRRRFILFAIAVGVGHATVRAALTPTPIDGDDADDSGNPYGIIVKRNVFHLVPLPPPPEPEKPKVELPTVKITGFFNVGGKQRALFMMEEKGKKDRSYYSLVEGEKSADGKLELVKIHPNQDAVDIINDGTAATLTVKDDALAQSAGAPAVPAAPAGGPPVPGAPSPAGYQPGKPPMPGNGIPGRPMFGGNRPGSAGFAFPTRGRVNLPQ